MEETDHYIVQMGILAENLLLDENRFLLQRYPKDNEEVLILAYRAKEDEIDMVLNSIQKGFDEVNSNLT